MTSAFALPERLRAKSDPDLIAVDEAHFAAIEACLSASIASLTDRLDEERLAAGGAGTRAFERDQTIHRLTARRRTLSRYGVDLCLGRMVRVDGEIVHVGRLGLTDDAGRTLLVDWRTPAAEPFFAATRARPMGLALRRRYRWSLRRVVDYWDEVLDGSAPQQAAPDDESAFLAELDRSRDGRMHDVLATVAADQDAVIRSGAAGTLVVDGGPGTGKTVVALHRTAYLLYADPRVRRDRGGVLFVGPHRPYLAYVADILPGLGEEGVRSCTLSELVAEGADAVAEPDPETAALKADARLVAGIETAVRFHQTPPDRPTVLELETGEVEIGTDDWVQAFDAVEPGTPHNEARADILDAVVAASTRRHPEPDPQELRRHRTLRAELYRAWPLIEAADLVADLYAVPAYLQLAAPWLTPAQRQRLRRPAGSPWTTADLPLLDAARRRLGDPRFERVAHRRRAAESAQRAEMDDVVADLIAADDSELLVMSMLRGDDLRDALVDEAGLPAPAPDQLAGPFAHLVVDEAQELTDAQWQMLLARCPSRSVTVVGDRAQARGGFAESWTQRLTRVGLDRIRESRLNVNYRTPREIMAAAEPVIRAVLPDAAVPISVRSNGIPVVEDSDRKRDAVLAAWLAAHPEGTACVIGDPTFAATDRIASLTPEQAKGLEFDLVVLVRPEAFGTGVTGAVDRYVAMTRATRQLFVLS